jgi:hypothetical protein
VAFWKREDSSKSSKPAITEEKASSGRNGKSGSLFSNQAYQLTQEFDFGLVRKGSNGPSELNVHVEEIIDTIHGRPAEPSVDNVSIENKTGGLPFDFMSVRQPESSPAGSSKSTVGPKSFGPVADATDGALAAFSEAAPNLLPTDNLSSFDILPPRSLESLAVSSATVASVSSLDETLQDDSTTSLNLCADTNAVSAGFGTSTDMGDTGQDDLLASFALPPASGREVSDVDDWQSPQGAHGLEEPSLLASPDDAVAQGDPLFDDLIESCQETQNEIQTFYPQTEDEFAVTASMAEASLEAVDLDWAAVNDDLSFDDFALPSLTLDSPSLDVPCHERLQAEGQGLNDDYSASLPLDDSSATTSPLESTSDDLIVQANARLEESLANDPFGTLPLHETVDLDIEPSFTLGDAIEDFGDLPFEITTEASAVRPEATLELPPPLPMLQPTFSWEAEAKSLHHQAGFEGPQFASPEFAIEDLDTDLGDLGLDDFVLAAPSQAQADLDEAPSHLQAALMAASAVVSDEPLQDFAAFECIDHLDLDHQHQLLLGAQGANHLGQPTWLLKGVTPDATVVLKTWDIPLADSSRIVQLQRANGPDGQGLYWVQVNDWQGVISNTLDEITLHTDLELLDHSAEGRTIA